MRYGTKRARLNIRRILGAVCVRVCVCKVLDRQVEKHSHAEREVARSRLSFWILFQLALVENGWKMQKAETSILQIALIYIWCAYSWATHKMRISTWKLTIAHHRLWPMFGTNFQPQPKRRRKNHIRPIDVWLFKCTPYLPPHAK